jgi:GAF domain-containing protein
MSTRETASDLKRKVLVLEGELAEARQQQAGTSDILRIISGSSSDIARVFDAIARSAARLCEGFDVIVLRVDGDVLRLVGHYGPMPAGDVALLRGTLGGRTVIERRLIHIEDLQNEIEEFPEGSALARERGHRTTLSVPLLRDGAAIGNIQVRRNEVRLFSDQQISLLKTFADQAVIAIENTRLFEAEQARTREVEAKSAELVQSLEYQTATSEVLQVISSSVSDAAPVFDKILGSCLRLFPNCDAFLALVGEDEMMHLIQSRHGLDTATTQRLQDMFPRPVRDSIQGYAIHKRQVLHYPDVMYGADVPTGLRKTADIIGVGNYSMLNVPMLWEGNGVGALTLTRFPPAPFTEKEIRLLKTFADQAVIAIENTRLFEAEQASKRELQETLEHQTATSDVLNVISRSPSRLQPVFDTLVHSAARLCQAERAQIFRREGTAFSQCASYGLDPRFGEYVKTLEITPSRGSVTGRVLLEHKTVQIPDVLADPDYSLNAAQRLGEFRTQLGVPLLREGVPIGVILLSRTTVRPFTEKQIELAETFADQAIIAIENTRLFEEVQARTSELQEALKQQTATADVLKVISRSAFDLQPVLQTLVENAVKLGAASWGHIYRFDGEAFRNIADYGAPREVIEFWQRTPLRPGRGSGAGRAAVERRTVHIPDVLADAEYQYADAQKSRGVRSLLAVPMLRGSTLIGVFALLRTEVRPFTQSEIELVETFADQAVIAIENTSLFDEVRARNRDLTALSEVGRAVSSTLDLKVVLKTVVERAVDLSGTDACTIFYYQEDTGRFELGETIGLDETIIARLRMLDIAARDSGLGEAIALRKPLLIPDLTMRASNPLRTVAIEAGFRAALIVPLLSADGPLGTLVLQRRKPGEFPETIVSLMQSFADQSAIALENARLFEEIAQKSRELEIASQHKSQFVANMSHELRTPLAAILGYAELMQEGFYESQGPKSLDALTRIRSNGKHLLGLINTVLDIAKIESGQFTLNMSEYAIESVVETVRAATESLAQNKKLWLTTSVDKSLPVGLGDEQRLTQVLLNLVGNAIKFTDAGEVSIAAGARNGNFAVSVTDTGPGIPLDQQDRIFDQFHQADSSLTKAKGGTGLGLAIAKQIVEMHGGRIWVVSTPGKGSTFQMELPTRAQFHKKTP